VIADPGGHPLRALRTPILLVVILLFACSSSSVPTTTTTEAPAALVEMPEECIDALVGYLRAIEPAVEGVDFENMGVDQLETLMTEVEELSGNMTAEIEALDCPDPVGSDDEAFAAVVALAEREAPGTVGYLEWVAALASGFGELGDASGDCETDIASLQSIIDEAGSMSELTMTQVIEVGGLVASISTSCSPERAEEYFSQDDVAAFLEED
jgi:hypothetical protein